MKRIQKYIILLVALMFVSCSEWLKVETHDKIMEDELFSSSKGYYTALNGIYKELCNSNLYGDALSVGTIDAMAQIYNIRNWGSHTLKNAAFFLYDQASMFNQISYTWQAFYKTLLNCNTLIEWCNTDNNVLTDSERNLILGECYALRAMLHFDILRLYGPIYSADNISEELLPYQK